LLADELLEYIFQNDKVVFILETIDCHHITSHSPKEYRCGLPNHNNRTAVSVKKSETLKTTIYSEEETIRGNLYTLIMYIKKYTFIEALKYLHKELGIQYTGYKTNKEEKKETPLDIFLKVKPKKKTKIDVKDIQFIDQEFISDYTPNLHISWLKEGIISKTARRFNIGYDYTSRRIVVPHRFWCGEENEYIGIIGRTILTSLQCEILDVPKYYPLKAYPKSINLYGLNENYKSIQEKGYVVLYEAEKSTLKRHSRLDETGVSACSHDLSDEQVKILIGLDVNIIVAWDKDISLYHIRQTCEKFYGLRPVSYIYDKWDVLGEKDSPADSINKIYNFLFNHRVEYNEKEHIAYLKEKEERENKR
jgi:DNA primase